MKIYRPVEKKKRGRPKGPCNVIDERSHRKYKLSKRFVEEYLVDLNATRAYQRAGYGNGNDQSDGVNAIKLLNQPKIQKMIADAEASRSQRVEISQDMVLKELALLAFCNIRDISTWDGHTFQLKPFGELTREQTAIISAIKVIPKQFGGIDLEFKTPSSSDKRACLVDLGKHLGMFWENNNTQIDPMEIAKKIQRAVGQMNECTGGTGAN